MIKITVYVFLLLKKINLIRFDYLSDDVYLAVRKEKVVDGYRIAIDAPITKQEAEEIQKQIDMINFFEETAL